MSLGNGGQQLEPRSRPEGLSPVRERQLAGFQQGDQGGGHIRRRPVQVFYQQPPSFLYCLYRRPRDRVSTPGPAFPKKGRLEAMKSEPRHATHMCTLRTCKQKWRWKTNSVPREELR